MNKTSGGDGIPVELSQVLKDDAVKVLHSICQQIGKLGSDHRTGKGEFSFQSQRKAMPKDAQTTVQLDSSHRLAKQCSEFSTGETKKTVRNFILGGSKITADGDCSHEIKGHLLLGRKAMTNLDSIL